MRHGAQAGARIGFAHDDQSQEKRNADCHSFTAPHADGHVRVRPILALGELIRLLGGDSDAVFRSAKFNERDLADPDGVLPIAVRGELLAQAAQATRCEHLGLLLGDHSGIRELGALGKLILTLSSVGEALEAIETFWLPLNRPEVNFVRRSGDQAALGYAVYDGSLAGMPQLQDGALALARNVMRGMLGADWRPTGVNLMRRVPRDPEFYANFFGAPCRFNATHSELIFPATTLEVRLKNRDAKGAGLARHRLDGNDWSSYVSRLAYRMLLQGDCSQKRVAAALGVSDRTLVRRLGNYGVIYLQVFEGARFAASRSLIRETNLPLAEIAVALGYNEASSFTRAFQRWAGTSPSQWRKSKAGPPPCRNGQSSNPTSSG